MVSDGRLVYPCGVSIVPSGRLVYLCCVRKYVGVLVVYTSILVCLVGRWCVSVVSGVRLACNLWCLMEGGFIWLLVDPWCICSVW